MTKLHRWVGAGLCALVLAAGPAFAGSPFNVEPGAAEHAVAVVSPNAGLWAWAAANVLPLVDQGVLWLAGIVLTAAGIKARAWFGVSMTATQEEQLRQAALTGAHLAIAAGEGLADKRGLVNATVTWMKEREPAIIGKLGFGDQVLAAIAVKMISGALSSAVAASVPMAVETSATERQPLAKRGGR